MEQEQKINKNTVFYIIKIAPTPSPQSPVSSQSEDGYLSSLSQCLFSQCVAGRQFIFAIWDMGCEANLNDSEKSLVFLYYLSPCPSLKEKSRELTQIFAVFSHRILFYFYKFLGTIYVPVTNATHCMIGCIYFRLNLTLLACKKCYTLYDRLYLFQADFDIASL